ncbi:uncharacterized protein SAMN06309944_1400 [Micrococcales bacterium KH10]|nr:uncharacterized protein SAMN06309944_1400 [Micrococcales bacterium KH10]
MFRISDGRIITSPSDLAVASACEFAFGRRLDALLGRIERVDAPSDPMAARASQLGDRHEQNVLARFKVETASVVEIERPRLHDDVELDAAIAATKAAFDDGADVVFQATFFDGKMIGFADFVVRQPDGRYQVVDTKLARSAKVTALMQLAAYAEQLEKIGVPVAGDVVLVLGDGSTSVHALVDIAPVFRARKQRLYDLVEQRVAADHPVTWESRQVQACGRCEWCTPEVERADDIIQVAGLRANQREALYGAGIATMTQLASITGPVAGIANATLNNLRNQARLQIQSHRTVELPYEVREPHVVAALPEPDEGDLYFDFEGDPLYSEPGMTQDETQWGLDYLFGMVDVSHQFTAFWAHNLAQERQALLDFLDFVQRRRTRYPKMHIYHYAPYEKTHLLSIAARHGVGEEQVDALLRDGVLVDLYPVVRRMLTVGSDSYSLKTIEHLYLPEEQREGDVETAAASVEAYWVYRESVQQSDEDEAAKALEAIADYNEVDCVSTAQLHRWLITTAAQFGAVPGTAQSLGDLVEFASREQFAAKPSDVAQALQDLAGDPSNPERTADQQALSLASAAVEYHRREAKSFWWSHFARLQDPVDDWADTRDVMVVESVRMRQDWEPPQGRQRSYRRELQLTGTFGAGSTLRAGANPFLVYDFGGPDLGRTPQHSQRPSHARVTVIDIDIDNGVLLLEERCPDGIELYDDVPLAVTPAAPVAPGKMPQAIEEWATDVLQAQPGWLRDPAADILRRSPSRLRHGELARPGDTGTPDTVTAIVESLLRLDNSYIAVQGPPGTGKTYTGAHVIASLVRDHGWKVGVVAQSHATIENLLRGVIAAGLPAHLVGKKLNPTATVAEAEQLPWQAVRSTGVMEFLTSAPGLVLGGTSWDFADSMKVGRRQLDLLVIDEAGQYSLATTISSAVAAKNLLLLGDPQQLPQVSQGTHPAPTDMSALGHLSASEDVLPAKFGYFLGETRRMTPELTRVVSDLSYAGKLNATGAALSRTLRAADQTSDCPMSAGLHPIEVPHYGRSTDSPEEAAKVVELVERLIGQQWSEQEGASSTRALTQQDFIVVTPYNAQVATISQALERAGLSDVSVGTVDKFQGREAVISVLSMAASSPTDVPRGMGFLLQRNRLNVAISRAQWASYLIYSPHLVDYLPATPAGVAELSAFLRLVERQ